MDTAIHMTPKPQTPLAMNAQKFGLWLFLVSVVLLFGALTSAYIVKISETGTLGISLPSIFIVNTAIIIASSASLQLAYYFAKRDNLPALRIAMVVTGLLGGLFIWGQLEAWDALLAMNVNFVGHPAGSFIYVFTGVHVVHLVSALIFLAIMLYASFRLRIHSRKLDRMEMCVTYWHFLGGLWIYLYAFLAYYN
ncbi:cytochrome c oxidase subunit 3 [Persicobacter sp. CCB-QB2]|uniref:cytochrome c oxidase subunit 3 n=1 Tax=Persicobacter sp. CCB-QB2 TaxID=1561025 RepID=UPI0006A9558D|nr:cytochrome c oxidase subunit 3 [Persicobacter sp. CCB-QB2]